MDAYQYGYLLGIVLGISLLFIIPMVFFVLTQHKVLSRVQPINRRMEPALVWLQFVPVLGVVWQFIVVVRIADSLRKEFASWGSDDSILGYTDPEAMTLSTSQPTYSIGIAYCILFCCSIIPLIGIFTFLAGLVCWIIYWVKLSDYNRKLRNYRAGMM